LHAEMLSIHVISLLNQCLYFISSW